MLPAVTKQFSYNSAKTMTDFPYASTVPSGVDHFLSCVLVEFLHLGTVHSVRHWWLNTGCTQVVAVVHVLDVVVVVAAVVQVVVWVVVCATRKKYSGAEGLNGCRLNVVSKRKHGEIRSSAMT